MGLVEARDDRNVPYGAVPVNDPQMAKFTSANAVPYNAPHQRDTNDDDHVDTDPADPYTYDDKPDKDHKPPAEDGD
jgi:hypothetical protein